MHAATLASERLKRVIKVLLDGKEHSTMEIVKCANVCAVNSAIAELRTHGIGIDCEQKGGRFYYKLGRYTSKHREQMAA